MLPCEIQWTDPLYSVTCFRAVAYHYIIIQYTDKEDTVISIPLLASTLCSNYSLETRMSFSISKLVILRTLVELSKM